MEDAGGNLKKTLRTLTLRLAGIQGHAFLTSRRVWGMAVLSSTLLGSQPVAAADLNSPDRGRYLVETIMACGNCHSPKGPDGRPIPGREYSGGGLTFNLPPFSGAASNITPDQETGIGTWTDDEIKRALTHGQRPSHGRLAGQPLGLPMWANFYKALLPSDLDAVVAYLRSLPPLPNKVVAPTYRLPVVRDAYPDAERGFKPDDLRDPVRRGAYLGTIGHCMECHTPVNQGVAQYEQALGAGGRPYLPSMVAGFPDSWKGSVSRNITSHRDLGIGQWTDSQIKRAITEGINRDGRPLQPPMGFHWYAGLDPEDLDALVAWLRTIPAKP